MPPNYTEIETPLKIQTASLVIPETFSVPDLESAVWDQVGFASGEAAREGLRQQTRSARKSRPLRRERFGDDPIVEGYIRLPAVLANEKSGG